MRPKVKQRVVRLMLILGLISGLCLFLAGALQENIVYFKTPSELLTSDTDIKQKLRLGGLVVVGSLKKFTHHLEFKVTDQTNTVNVTYSGRLPDLFREGQGVVAIGTYSGRQQLFSANQLLAKHDQYYRPPGIKPTPTL